MAPNFNILHQPAPCIPPSVNNFFLSGQGASIEASTPGFIEHSHKPRASTPQRGRIYIEDRNNEAFQENHGKVRYSTPVGGRSLNRLDAFGRKSTKPKKANNLITGDAKPMVEIEDYRANNAYPIMDSIGLEIRTHLEEAKQEITIL